MLKIGKAIVSHVQHLSLTILALEHFEIMLNIWMVAELKDLQNSMSIFQAIDSYADVWSEYWKMKRILYAGKTPYLDFFDSILRLWIDFIYTIL
jgi:hypothetical protein